MRRRPVRGGALAWAILLLVGEGSAEAGGVIRPNINGARAVGMAGAYAAVADDALAIFHNPAGLARIKRADLVLSLELPFIIRRATPVGRATERPVTSTLPVPYVAGGYRFRVGQNSSLALGIGVYNSAGGSIRFDKDKVSEGVLRSFVALFEVTPTIAYAISDRIFIGLGLRMGLAFFAAQQSCNQFVSCAHNDWGASNGAGPADPQFDSTVSTMFGGGFGVSLGVQVLPTDWLSIGITYRSNLTVTPKKDDAVKSASPDPFDAKIRLPFPQSVAIGLAFQVHRRVLLAVQFGWVDNSRFQSLFLDIEGWTGSRELINTPLDMRDSFSGHLGTEISLTKRIKVRAGMAYDSPSIPEENQQRHLVDSHKLTFDAGATFLFLKNRFRLDIAAELLYGNVANGFRSETNLADASVCPDGAEACSWASPGTRHPGGVFSFHVAAGYTF